jgi:hypothetical protein
MNNYRLVYVCLSTNRTISELIQGGTSLVAPQLTVVMLPLPFPVVVSAWVDVLGVWVQPKGAGGP